MSSSAEKRHLFIDLETFSSVDITKAGAFKYVESDDFEILLLAYAWNEEPVRVLDLTTPLRPISEEDKLREVLEEKQIGRASCRERVSPRV